MRRFECPRCNGIMYLCDKKPKVKCCSCFLVKTLKEAKDEALVEFVDAPSS